MFKHSRADHLDFSGIFPDIIEHIPKNAKSLIFTNAMHVGEDETTTFQVSREHLKIIHKSPNHAKDVWDIPKSGRNITLNDHPIDDSFNSQLLALMNGVEHDAENGNLDVYKEPYEPTRNISIEKETDAVRHSIQSMSLEDLDDVSGGNGVESIQSFENNRFRASAARKTGVSQNISAHRSPAQKDAIERQLKADTGATHLEPLDINQEETITLLQQFSQWIKKLFSCFGPKTARHQKQDEPDPEEATSRIQANAAASATNQNASVNSTTPTVVPESLTSTMSTSDANLKAQIRKDIGNNRGALTKNLIATDPNTFHRLMTKDLRKDITWTIVTNVKNNTNKNRPQSQKLAESEALDLLVTLHPNVDSVRDLEQAPFEDIFKFTSYFAGDNLAENETSLYLLRIVLEAKKQSMPRATGMEAIQAFEKAGLLGADNCENYENLMSRMTQDYFLPTSSEEYIDILNYVTERNLLSFAQIEQIIKFTQSMISEDLLDQGQLFLEKARTNPKILNTNHVFTSIIFPKILRDIRTRESNQTSLSEKDKLVEGSTIAETWQNIMNHLTYGSWVTDNFKMYIGYVGLISGNATQAKPSQRTKQFMSFYLMFNFHTDQAPFHESQKFSANMKARLMPSDLMSLEELSAIQSELDIPDLAASKEIENYGIHKPRYDALKQRLPLAQAELKDVNTRLSNLNDTLQTRSAEADNIASPISRDTITQNIAKLEQMKIKLDQEIGQIETQLPKLESRIEKEKPYLAFAKAQREWQKAINNFLDFGIFDHMSEADQIVHNLKHEDGSALEKETGEFLKTSLTPKRKSEIFRVLAERLNEHDSSFETLVNMSLKINGNEKLSLKKSLDIANYLVKQGLLTETFVKNNPMATKSLFGYLFKQGTFQDAIDTLNFLSDANIVTADGAEKIFEQLLESHEGELNHLGETLVNQVNDLRRNIELEEENITSHRSLINAQVSAGAPSTKTRNELKQMEKNLRKLQTNLHKLEHKHPLFFKTIEPRIVNEVAQKSKTSVPIHTWEQAQNVASSIAYSNLWLAGLCALGGSSRLSTAASKMLGFHLIYGKGNTEGKNYAVDITPKNLASPTSLSLAISLLKHETATNRMQKEAREKSHPESAPPFAIDQQNAEKLDAALQSFHAIVDYTISDFSVQELEAEVKKSLSFGDGKFLLDIANQKPQLLAQVFKDADFRTQTFERLGKLLSEGKITDSSFKKIVTSLDPALRNRSTISFKDYVSACKTWDKSLSFALYATHPYFESFLSTLDNSGLDGKEKVKVLADLGILTPENVTKHPEIMAQLARNHFVGESVAEQIDILEYLAKKNVLNLHMADLLIQPILRLAPPQLSESIFNRIEIKDPSLLKNKLLSSYIMPAFVGDNYVVKGKGDSAKDKHVEAPRELTDTEWKKLDAHDKFVGLCAIYEGSNGMPKLSSRLKSLFEFFIAKSFLTANSEISGEDSDLLGAITIDDLKNKSAIEKAKSKLDTYFANSSTTGLEASKKLNKLPNRLEGRNNSLEQLKKALDKMA